MSIRNAKAIALSLVAALGLAAMTGCGTTRVELITLREGLVGVARPALVENIATAKNREAAGTMLRSDVELREKNLTKFDGLVETSRKQDAITR